MEYVMYCLKIKCVLAETYFPVFYLVMFLITFLYLELLLSVWKTGESSVTRPRATGKRGPSPLTRSGPASSDVVVPAE